MLEHNNPTDPAAPGQSSVAPPAVLSPAAPLGPLTWESMAAMEPGLRDLLREAASTPFSWPTYKGFKRRLQELVGWNARRRELASNEAYEIAFRRIVAALESRGRRPRRLTVADDARTTGKEG